MISKKNLFVLIPIACSFLLGCNSEAPRTDFTANIYGEGLKFKEGQSLSIHTGVDFTCTVDLDRDFLKNKYPDLTPVDDFFGLPTNENFTVSINNQVVTDYVYNSTTGAFSISGSLITGDLNIQAKYTELNPYSDNVVIVFYAGSEDYQHFPDGSPFAFETVDYGTTFKEIKDIAPTPVPYDDPEQSGGHYVFDYWHDYEGKRYEDGYSFKEEAEMLIAAYKFVPGDHKVMVHASNCTFFGEAIAKHEEEYRCIFSPKTSAEKNYILTDDSLISLRIGGQELTEGYTFKRLDNLLDFELVIPAQYVMGNIDIEVTAEENVLTGLFYSYNQVLDGFNVTDYYLDLIAEVIEPITSLTIPNVHSDLTHGSVDVVRINDNAFHWYDIGDIGIELPSVHVNLPLRLKEIGNSAFADFHLSTVDENVSPVSVVIPQGVVEIGEFAFGASNYNADNACIYAPYRNATAVSNMERINPKWNYKEVVGFDDIALPVEYAGDANKLKFDIDLETQKYCVKELTDDTVTDLIIPNVYYDYAKAGAPTSYPALHVISIANGAFSENTTLTTVTLPSHLQTIESEAFKGCTGLGSDQSNPFIIPSTVQTIGENAFTDWTATQYIQISASSLVDATHTVWGWELEGSAGIYHCVNEETLANIIVRDY